MHWTCAYICVGCVAKANIPIIKTKWDSVSESKIAKAHKLSAKNHAINILVQKKPGRSNEL